MSGLPARAKPWRWYCKTRNCLVRTCLLQEAKLELHDQLSLESGDRLASQYTGLRRHIVCAGVKHSVCGALCVSRAPCALISRLLVL